MRESIGSDLAIYQLKDNYFSSNHSMETSVQMSKSMSGVKLIFLLSILFLLASDLSAQQILQRSYSAVKGINGMQSLETTNSELMIAGYDRFDTLQPSNYFTDALIMRTDSMGNVLWNKTYGGIDDDMFNDIIRSQDGNYVSVGYTESYGTYGIEYWDSLKYNIYVVKVDDAGNPIWSRVYGDTLNDFGVDVLEKDNGDLVILAFVHDHYIWDNNSGDVMILCLDSAGAQKWSKVLYSLNGYRLVPQQIVKSHDGGYYVCGEISYLDTIGGWIDAMVIRTDSLGNIIWAKRMNGGASFNPTRIVTSPDNGVFLGFTTMGFGATTASDFVITQIDSNGNSQLAVRYGSAMSDNHITAISLCNDGSGLFLGSFGRLIKIDKTGNVLWSRSTFGLYGNSINSIIEKPSRGLYLLGQQQFQNVGYTSASHLDSIGTFCDGNYLPFPFSNTLILLMDVLIADSIISLSVDSGCVTGSISVFDSLYCNTATYLQDVSEWPLISFYPNPVSDLLYLKYNNLFSEWGIRIYNIQGQLTYYSDHKPDYINLGSLNRGMYYLEVCTDGKKEIYKLICL